MSTRTTPYLEQAACWPREGRHILAQFDAETIVVYQAYSHEIADYAVSHQRFGGGFSYSRMSWIKPNFLWMMFRSDWGRSPRQERVLAIRLPRRFFDDLLRQAVPSSYARQLFVDQSEWKSALGRSDVRLQWDPDHDPNGRPLSRRAIQLGLRGETLIAYGQRELIEIIDMTTFVGQQRSSVSQSRLAELVTPSEEVYRPVDESVAQWVGLEPKFDASG